MTSALRADQVSTTVHCVGLRCSPCQVALHRVCPRYLASRHIIPPCFETCFETRFNTADRLEYRRVAESKSSSGKDTARFSRTAHITG
ncbi:hypothetical protein BDQ94DRAFT_132272 [Aspergillus welwitschiae]|uniref:Uncharacterized protein n=1 Tax=Aspergillus welwitschiae TaxID=1341132 RepID=A0A3F3QIW1_9EURO|nr:hypothetical protein BDQ94DRAFT_132272 [Aspergillus welwitschiae]RDH39057.1 hypothetical protein BDQ94DRAFT_132272 [Aspergillus welwitschiae]